jgi:hypothetical protein
MREYARRGAEARILELRQEMDAIYAAFPDLRPGGRGTRGRAAAAGTMAASGDSSGATPRRGRRRSMSAAQRKAVSERMRRYWAERRKQKTSAKK